jgi:hypothetical protein
MAWADTDNPVNYIEINEEPRGYGISVHGVDYGRP